MMGEMPPSTPSPPPTSNPTREIIAGPPPGAPLASEKLLEMKGPREKVDRVADASARPLLTAGPGSSDTDPTPPLALQQPGSQGAFPGTSDPTALDPKPFLSRQEMLCVCVRARAHVYVGWRHFLLINIFMLKSLIFTLFYSLLCVENVK